MSFELTIILVAWFVVFPFFLWFPRRADSGWYRRLRGGVWVYAYAYWIHVPKGGVADFMEVSTRAPMFHYEDHRRKK